MRSWNAAQEHAYDTPTPELVCKVEVRDSGGTLREWTNIDGNGLNVVTALEWGDSLNQNGADGALTFAWKPTEHDRLSPFWSSGRWASYLDIVRDVVVSVKVIPPGADPSAFSWIEVFRASIDDVDLSGELGVLPLRDLIMAELMDGWITSNKRYGNTDGSVTLDDVADGILSDYDKQANTLTVPVASTFSVKPYVQQKVPILRAIADLYFLAGWDVRPLWNTTASAFRLTAYNPDRATTTAGFSFPPSHVAKFTQFSISASNIRNWVKVYFGDTAIVDESGNDLRKYVERLDETSPANDPTGSVVANSSIDRYKWRFMSFAEGSTSLIDNVTAAGQFADYAIADLADPTFLGAVELAYLFWPVEVNDLYQFNADGKRFDTNQKFAVTAYRHAIDFAAGKHKTTLSLQGKPSLGRDQYFMRAAGPGGGAPVDDVAPQAPTITLTQTPLGVSAVVDVTGVPDYDQVLFFVGPVSGFTPSSANLVQASRSATYFHALRSGTERQWLKVQLRDKTGNVSTAAGPVALVGKKADSRQLSQPLQAKTELGLYSNLVVTGYGEVAFTKYQAGEFLGDYNLATGRFYAREGGTYRVALSGKLSTSMTEGTDYYLCLIRDPAGDADEVGRAVVTSGAFHVEAFVPMDQDDELEVQVCNPGGGTFSNVTFSATYTTLRIELAGTQSRTKPYPFVEADPVFLDHGPAGTYSSASGECHAVFRLKNGEIAFCNGAAGAAYPARLHRNEVDTNKARSITVSGSTDYWFGAIAEGADRSLYLCTNKVDATASYSVKKYTSELALSWTATSLGATIESRCVAHVGSVVTNDPVYVGTAEPSNVGKVRAYNTTTGALLGTATATLATVNSLCHVNPNEPGGGYVVAMCSDVTAPDIVALDASDVTATEIWRIQLDALATPGTSDDACELKTSPDYSVIYAIGGTTNPTLYAIAATGEIVWSVDVGTVSTLTDVTGCLSIDVHPTTGDIACLCYYADTQTELDCVVFDPDGNARWSWRDLGDLDPGDDPLWTSSTTGHRIAFATDGAIWISGGGSSSAYAKVIRPYSEIPDNPPSVLTSQLMADFDPEVLGLANGAAISDWPAKRGRRNWRLENDTASEQPKMRGKWDAATVATVSRTLEKFAAVEFDGTERLIGNEESAILQDGAICVLVCEPVNTTGDYFSGYTDAGTPSAPLLELWNNSGRLTWGVNIDGAQDTTWDHASRSGLQVVAVRGASTTEAGIWLSNAEPNQTAALGGTDATPDGNPRVRLGQAGSSSGDWFEGWVYRWIWLEPSGFSASRVASIVHWARAYYEIPEVAVEDVPTSFGTTATFQQKTNYFSGSGLEVWAMSGRGLTDQCAIGRRLSSANNDGLKLIDNAGGTSWTADNSGISAAAQSCYGIFTNADYVWWCFDGNSGSRAVAQRVGVSDGVVDWTSNTGTGSPTNGLGRTVALDVANDDLIVLWNDSGDEVQAVDATSGTLGNDTDDSSVTSSQGACAVCVTGDGSLLLVAGDNERVEYHSTPLANGSAGGGTLNFASGSTDVTNTATGFSALHNADTPEPTLSEDRNGGTGAWLSGGRSANHNDPYLWHINPTTPSVDIEKNVTSDWGISNGTYNYVMDHCQDKYGHVWALCTNGFSASDACDVVRYEADGTFVQSFASDSVSNLPTGIARSIAIDESGNLYIGDKNGDVSVWTMS